MGADEDLYDELLAPPLEQSQPPKRRKRVRMGQVMSQLGGRGKPELRTMNPAKAVQNRERQEAGQRLLEGGRNKGERRGFGLTESD